MPKQVPLASAGLPSTNSELRIDLVGNEVVITWPAAPTKIDHEHLADLAATACRVLANSSIEMARFRAGQKR